MQMSKKEKLFKRLQQVPSDFTFHELTTLLNYYSFEKQKTNAGSHFKWKNTEKNITYSAPRKNPMKKIYLKQLLDILIIYF